MYMTREIPHFKTSEEQLFLLLPYSANQNKNVSTI
jgi:hypothetical protein